MKVYSSLGFEGAYGWGVLTHHLHRELAKRCDLTVFPPRTALDHPLRPDGHGLVATVGPLRVSSPLRGAFNHGLGLFDHAIGEELVRRAARFDLLFVGSTWCAGHLKRAGIGHAVPFVQGVDTARFSPGPEPAADDPWRQAFVVFSGGKLEHRKGQDLAIAAVRVLQERHPDVVFLTAWHNYLGERSLQTMAASPHIRFELRGETTEAWSRHLCEINGLDPARTICLGEMPHDAMPEIYRRCHVGLFPNRCEAATNLVLAEFMACGRPVVASHSFGQRDLLAEDHALLLEPRAHLGTLNAEPSVAEIVAALEFLHQNRVVLPYLGKKAREAMGRFTWEATAATFVEAMAGVEAAHPERLPHNAR